MNRESVVFRDGSVEGKVGEGNTAGRDTVACAASLYQRVVFGQYARVICGIEG